MIYFLSGALHACSDGVRVGDRWGFSTLSNLSNGLIGVGWGILFGGRGVEGGRREEGGGRIAYLETGSWELKVMNVMVHFLID